MMLSITLIDGPTALIEIDGFRLLTDPTFDGPGAYQLPHVKLEKPRPSRRLLAQAPQDEGIKPVMTQQD
jgi:L-ascorbate metabolism protein UlaG (beta-lactamase superfamily)